MKSIENLYEVVKNEYENKYIESKEVFFKGKDFFINGVSQVGRKYEPFPLFITSANSKFITSVDNVKFTDYWLGHFISIFGHSHPMLKKNISLSLANNSLFQTGQCNVNEEKLSTMLSKYTPYNKFIYGTSGAQVTMLGIMCALSYTNKEKVFKVSGGWHGVQPWTLNGVKKYTPDILESSGIPSHLENDTFLIEFNNIKHLEESFKKNAEEVAVLILELTLGNSGMIVADPKFIKRCEELCKEYNVLFFIDEIVTGFRTRKGLLSDTYEVQADLVSLGKTISGGIPFACLTGKSNILNVINTNNKKRVMADMGTFTSHPLALSSAITFFEIMEKEGETYFEKSSFLMNKLRNGIEKLARLHNINIVITGKSTYDKIPDSPISTIRFLLQDGFSCEEYRHWDNRCFNNDIRDKILRLFLINHGIFAWQGLGTISIEHDENDIDYMLEVYEKFFILMKEYLN